VVLLQMVRVEDDRVGALRLEVAVLHAQHFAVQDRQEQRPKVLDAPQVGVVVQRDEGAQLRRCAGAQPRQQSL
ncbi:MAG: hypothetical protein ACK56I_03050, partial [bacterium]